MLAGLLALASATPTSSSLPSAPDPLGGEDDPSCYDEDKSGGFGDSHSDCNFDCQRGNVLSVYVESSDTVPVSGNADCGGAHGHCQAKQRCAGTSTGATTKAGGGTCSAQSDEAWSSYLYAECAAEAAAVCWPVCSNWAEGVVAEILVIAGDAVGQVCRDGDCTPVVPTPTPGELVGEINWIIDQYSPAGTIDQALQLVLEAVSEAARIGEDVGPILKEALAAALEAAANSVGFADDLLDGAGDGLARLVSEASQLPEPPVKDVPGDEPSDPVPEAPLL